MASNRNSRRTKERTGQRGAVAFTGVRHREAGSYQAEIQGKHVGTFETIAEAAEACQSCRGTDLADTAGLPRRDSGDRVMTTRTRKLQNDLAYPPRAMRAERAAAYLDMSRSKFLELVKSGPLPHPKTIDGIRIWDRLALDAAFNDLPEHDANDKLPGRRNTFDEILGG
jgi:hypothetical protein